MIKRKPKKGSKTTPDLSLLKKKKMQLLKKSNDINAMRDPQFNPESRYMYFLWKIIIINGACRLAGDSFQFKYNVNTHFEEYYKVH